MTLLSVLSRTLVTTSCLAVAAAQADARCFPVLDDEVLVYFEAGDLDAPIVIGSLWNDEKSMPESRGEGTVGAPRVLARAILDVLGAQVESDRDTEAGKVARMLAESVAMEIEALYAALERAYESGFVDHAESRDGFVLEGESGVFEANVGQSIQQVEAYAALVAEVTKSLDAFAEAGGDDPSRADDLLALAADLIDLDLSVRDPDCD